MYSNTYDDTIIPPRKEFQPDSSNNRTRNVYSGASGMSLSNSSGIGSLSSMSSSVQQLQVEVPGGDGAGGGSRKRCGSGCDSRCGGCGCGTRGCCWRAVVVIIGLCILGTIVGLLTVYLLDQRMKISSLGCREQYTLSDQHSASGGIDVGWQSVSSCMRLCENNIITCYGLDYSDEGICWLHLHQPYKLNLGNTPGVKNYRRQFHCDPELLCVEKYTITTDRQAEGGMLIDSVSSVPACKEHCETSHICYGFDHKDEFGKGKCWIHFSSSYMLSSQPAPGFTNYRRLFRCRRDTIGFTTLRPIFTTRRVKK